jgi:hypothetical protein
MKNLVNNLVLSVLLLKASKVGALEKVYKYA